MPTPTSAEGGEANRCVFENADGQRCILTHGHTEPHTAPTLAATGGEEDAVDGPAVLVEFAGRAGATRKPLLPMLCKEVAALRRQLAEAKAGVARQDRKWMDAIRRIAGREICFSPGWAGHDHTKVPHPTLEQFVNELRERATTAERRLEEACEQAGCDGDHAALPDAVKLIREQRDYAIYSDRVAQDALTASQQEVARLREVLTRAIPRVGHADDCPWRYGRDCSCDRDYIHSALSSPHQSTGQGGGV